MKHFFIPPIFILVCLLCLVNPTHAANDGTPTVEFTHILHFLTPAGEDVEVGAGIYQVEAAESWLKLVPVGESRSTAVLLEAIRGPHEEEVTDPIVRTISNPDTPDVLHVALLMPDGVGMEAVGTVTGIRPRALNFAFVGKSRRTLNLASKANRYAPQSGSQTQAPTPGPKGQPVDCGPYQKVIGKAKRHSPALAVYQNALHLVTSDLSPPPSGLYKYTTSGRLREGGPLKHWIYSNGQWDKGTEIEGQYSKTHVALAVFQNRIHMVHLGKSENDLWYSTYDGRRWTTNVRIPRQKSKVAPALKVLKNQLHMVHLDNSSNAIWHSVNKGNGWTVNVKIPYVGSDRPPALGRVPNGPLSGRLHMVFKQEDRKGQPGKALFHAQFDGRQWRKPVKIDGPFSSQGPALVSGYPDQLHMIHLGARSNDLWHMLFGPNKKKNNRVEWFDEQRLLSEHSKHPVSVALFQGCYHMVSHIGDNFMHTTFSPAQVHPTVR